MPIERRCAMVPGSDFLSPEEAQLILRRRKSLCSVAVSSLDRRSSQASRQPAKPSHKDDRTGSTWRPRAFERPESRHQLAGLVQDCAGEPHPASIVSTNDPRSSSFFHLPSRGQTDHSQCESPSRIYTDNKRKHTMDWQDSPRRHPAEVLEDTPHVSELDSDDLINPMELNDNQGRSGIGDKVGYCVHRLALRVRNLLIRVHSPKPINPMALQIPL